MRAADTTLAWIARAGLEVAVCGGAPPGNLSATLETGHPLRVVVRESKACGTPNDF